MKVVIKTRDDESIILETEYHNYNNSLSRVSKDGGFKMDGLFVPTSNISYIYVIPEETTPSPKPVTKEYYDIHSTANETPKREE